MNFRNFRLAFRLLLKHKSISFINIFGLAVSLACTLFILLWVQHELSYDRFHPDYKQLFRVEEDQYYSNPEPYHVNVTPQPSGPVWKEEIADIVEQCRVAWSGGILLTNGDKKFFEDQVIATDSSFFKMFGFTLLKGDPDHILDRPNTLVLAESVARKYFGTSDAIGNTIQVNNNEYYEVTGIMADPPKNTIIPSDVLLPWSYRAGQSYYNDDWGSNSIFTYVKLREGTSDTTMNRMITEVTNKYKDENTIDFSVAPMHRIHLYSYFGFGKSPGAIMYVYIFSAVALFVLLIACINFMNMSTARSSVRAKEIGLRKVSGASRPSLIRQYLAESYIQTIVAVIIALLLVFLLLPKFNTLSGKDIVAGRLFTWRYLGGILGVIAVTGILAGLYPAFYLSSVRPVRAIKEHTDSRKGTGLLRKGLVVFQFSLSVLLIAGAMIISRQLNYMRNAPLGFDTELLLNIPLRGGLSEKYDVIKEEFLKQPDIKYVSATMGEAHSIGSNSANITWPGKDDEQEVLVSFSGVDYNYTDAMGITFWKGRGFSPDYPGDMYQDTAANFIINKTLADIIGSDDIIDMEISFMGIQGQVKGVMNDFHFKPLSNEIEPLAMIPIPPLYAQNMVVKLETSNIDNAIKNMEATWNDMVSQFPFEFTFVDENIEKMYTSESRMAKLVRIFTLVAVLIACMGLFALASFTAERRTREIGVRKTFGAGEINITWVMIRDTVKLIGISLLIGIPGAWYLAKWWLQDFYYRIDLGWDVFVIAAVVSLLVSVITVTYHAVRSSRLNPVLALRYE